jgi:hypothetical protein
MNVLSTIGGFFPLLALCFYVHPIHVSVTEIEYDPRDRTLEIMMRVFIDDFELTLRNSLNKPDLDVLNPGKEVSLDDMISGYLQNHLRISLDNKLQKTNYLGHEREAEAFIFYVEVTGVSKWQTITIHNDVIMSTYDDQSNIVHVYVNDRVRSTRLTRHKPAENLSFDYPPQIWYAVSYHAISFRICR